MEKQYVLPNFRFDIQTIFSLCPEDGLDIKLKIRQNKLFFQYTVNLIAINHLVINPPVYAMSINSGIVTCARPTIHWPLLSTAAFAAEFATAQRRVKLLIGRITNLDARSQQPTDLSKVKSYWLCINPALFCRTSAYKPIFVYL